MDGSISLINLLPLHYVPYHNDRPSSYLPSLSAGMGPISSKRAGRPYYYTATNPATAVQ